MNWNLSKVIKKSGNLKGFLILMIGHIGMIRKSVPATIVTSLFVIVFRQVIISKNATNQESCLQIFLVVVITFAMALFIFKKKISELY